MRGRLHLQLLLLAGLRICSARQPGFSIHDDLLAYPQFEVVFAETYISESDALALLETKSGAPDHPTHATSLTDLTRNVRESPTPSSDADADASSHDDGSPKEGEDEGEEEDDEGAIVSETYELMIADPGAQRYLCAVPVLAPPPPPPNQTASALAKAAEARELSRASARGWELMSALDGQCLFFMSGWWSYQFCYGGDIVQFHVAAAAAAAAAAGRQGANNGGGNNGVVSRDMVSQEFVLGRSHEDHLLASSSPSRSEDDDGEYDKYDTYNNHDDSNDGGDSERKRTPPNTELQVKGDQRYLVQRLDGGTVCDLTGRERMVEVQYRCQPGAAGDRIGWIKEVTTCTYLMLVLTPRLCADVAFLPPRETRAHPIRCSQIVGSEKEAAAWRAAGGPPAIEGGRSVPVFANEEEQDEAEDEERQNQNQHQHAGVTIGGVVVGSHRLLSSGAEDGQPAIRLPPSRHFSAGRGGANAGGNNAIVEMLAQARAQAEDDDGEGEGEGQGIEIIDAENIAQLDLDLPPEEVEALRQQLQRLAGEHGWRLEVVEVPGQALAQDEGDEEREGVNAPRKQQGQGQAPKKKTKAGGTATGGSGRGGGGGGGGSRDRGRQKKAPGGNDNDDNDGGAEQGSEEKFFKEEL